MSLHNLYSKTNVENQTIFANENCSEFFLGKLSDINQTITNFPQDVESDNFDQRGMNLIEEMKKTVKIGEECFKRERRFKSEDSDEWKWSSYFSTLHIYLPIICAIIVCPIMVKKQEDRCMGLLHFCCPPWVPLTKIYSAVVEIKSHYYLFKYRGGPKFIKKATQVAKWTKIVANIGMFLKFNSN